MTFLDWILYVFIAVCSLMFMIMVHELGHYTAGKILKFKINEFSIGFGKSIFSKKRKDGELFSIRALPLGGYCAFEEEEREGTSRKSFNSQAPWKRLIVLFMGPFFNFLSAILFAGIFLMAFGYPDKVKIVDVKLPETATEEEWLKEGDVVLAVNGVHTNLVDDAYFSTLISPMKEGEDFVVTVMREGKKKDLTIRKTWFELDYKEDPVYSKLFSLDNVNYNYAIVTDDETKKIVKLGETSIEETFIPNAEGMVKIGGVTYFFDGETLNSALVGVMAENYRCTFFESGMRSVSFCAEWVQKILITLGQLVNGEIGIKNVGGLVTTVATIAEVTKKSFINLLLLIPLISVNLAVFNLIPFPALDGAKMVFTLIEWIFKKPVPRRIEGMLNTAGLFLLLGFIVVVDILHFVL